MASTLAPSTVYKVAPSAAYAQRNATNSNPQPTMLITGGTVDVYISLDTAEPANTGAMVLLADATNITGIHYLAASALWIAYEVNTGAPVVQEHRIVSGATT